MPVFFEGWAADYFPRAAVTFITLWFLKKRVLRYQESYFLRAHTGINHRFFSNPFPNGFGPYHPTSVLVRAMGEELSYWSGIPGPRGQVAEWLMAADCKSAALRSYGGSNPPLSTSSGIAVYGLRDAHREMGDWGSVNCGSNSVGRVTAFQAVGRGFESRLPLQDLNERRPAGSSFRNVDCV
jgi:hypothetical protein